MGKGAAMENQGGAIELDAVQARLLGVLMEKKRATQNGYPLLLNGFTGAPMTPSIQTVCLQTIALATVLWLTAAPAYVQGASIEWETLNQEVTDLYRAGQYDRAVVVAKKALEVAEKDVGPNHPDVALSLNNLAWLYRTQGHYAQAEPLYRRSLAILERALGPDHPAVALSLNNLAGLYDTQGQYAQAEPLYRRSLAIRERALGPDHPDVAQGLNNLALLYKTQGHYAQAEPLY
ncbi:MAG: hypothetical protein CO080_03560, partial [Nitrospirae bacterium CG_4_9_14_0_8_um_filter_70_14]